MTPRAMGCHRAVGAMPAAFRKVLELCSECSIEWIQTNSRQLRLPSQPPLPVVGHVRYLVEKIRPEIRQYLLEADNEKLPFSRSLRVSRVASHAGLRPLRPEDKSLIVLGACARTGTITAALRAVQDQSHSNVHALVIRYPTPSGTFCLPPGGPIPVAMMTIGQ